MGAAMPFAFSSSDRRHQSKFSQLLALLRRAAILFCLGLFLNNGHYLNDWRIPGVLQRFAVAYFVVGAIYLFVPKIYAGRQDIPLLAAHSDEIEHGLNTAR